jgi:hypothetical protein
MSFERPQIASPRIIRTLSKISFIMEFRSRFQIIRLGFVAENSDWDISLPLGTSVSSVSVVLERFHINLTAD